MCAVDPDKSCGSKSGRERSAEFICKNKEIENLLIREFLCGVHSIRSDE